MSTGFKQNHKHMWQNLNKKRKASGKKYEKSIKTYKKLIKRIEIEGETKWIKNAINNVKSKFKKYSITEFMIK